MSSPPPAWEGIASIHHIVNPSRFSCYYPMVYGVVLLCRWSLIWKGVCAPTDKGV